MVQDLTQGNPGKVLWRFTIPMFISVIFQQMYSIADSVIAGKFAGEDALAAVGASYPITMIFMAIAVGCNIGCSVVISQLFGAKKLTQMKTAVSTTMLASLVLSLVLTLLGIVFSPVLMKMIQTPDNIFADGDLYLRIYTGGFAFLFLYNIATGIFTSLGDSKTPLYFLIGSSLGNVALDWLFVAVFSWGVAGVAWATFIAQGIACVLALAVLLVHMKKIKTPEKPPLFSKEMLWKISQISIPSILQQSFVSIGNIFIQILINGFGSSVIAGYSAAIKLNTFSITCLTTLGNGISNYSAQNFGAKKPERIRQGMRADMILALTLSFSFTALFCGFGQQMIALFMKEQSALAMQTGVQFLYIVSPFYFVIAIKILSDGVLRGIGNMTSFMISTFSDLILRVILSWIMSSFWGTIGIWLSWPIGWSTGAILSRIFYRKANVTNKYERI